MVSKAGLCLCVLMLCACSTLRSSYRTGDWMGAFPPDSSGYLAARGKTTRLLTVLQPELFSSDKLVDILNKTKIVYAAFGMLPDNQVEYYLILVGSYPYALINMSLDLDKQWKQSGEAPVWFYNAEHNIKICNPDYDCLLVTNGDMEFLRAHYQFPKARILPAEANNNLTASEFFLYVPDFAGVIVPGTIPFNKERLPVQVSWLYGVRNVETCDLGGYFDLQTSDGSVLFVKSFKLFLPWLFKQGKIATRDVAKKLKTIGITNTDNKVRFEHITLTDAELESLLGVFLTP